MNKVQWLSDDTFARSNPDQLVICSKSQEKTCPLEKLSDWSLDQVLVTGHLDGQVQLFNASLVLQKSYFVQSPLSHFPGVISLDVKDQRLATGYLY